MGNTGTVGRGTMVGVGWKGEPLGPTIVVGLFLLVTKEATKVKKNIKILKPMIKIFQLR